MLLKRWNIVLLCITLTVAACSSDGSSDTATDPDPDEPTPPSDEVTGDASDGEDEVADDPVPATLEECETVHLDPGEVIPGADLGACMAAAMRVAGSGSQRYEDSEGETRLIDFAWTPEFSMTVDGGDIRTYIHGDDGWVSLEGAGWIKADHTSEDPQVVMATSMVDLTRAAGHPEVMVSVYGQVDWRVIDLEEVPVDDAVANNAMHLVPTGPYTVAGVTVTDVHLYLTAEYLGAYFVGTGSASGYSVTTSNTFLQWGGEVDIVPPDLDPGV